MMSGASDARSRLPMLTCLRIPTAANCWIALFAAGKVRPIDEAAFVTVTTGAPGSAWSKTISRRISTHRPEGSTPVCLNPPGTFLKCGSVSHCSGAGDGNLSATFAPPYEGAYR
jgi:hypothetical protein